MNKLLTIAVPRFQESEQEIFPLLSSISSQIGVDMRALEVIIVTDGNGGPPLDENFLGFFGFETKQIRLEENKGCGPARQAAIDIAQGKYILCCDADDALYSVSSLAALLSDAETTGADLLISDFVEEIRRPDGSVFLQTRKPTACWMHGKLMRLDFLREQNIRFPDDLRDHEDSYFLGVAMALANNMRYLEVPTYLWRFNPDSITRQNHFAYAYDKHPQYVQAVTQAYHEILHRRPELVPEKIVQFVHHNFFLLHRADWLGPAKKTALENAERAFAFYIKPFWPLYTGADPVGIAAAYNAERRRIYHGVETETLGAWLQRLGLKEG